MMGRHVDRKWSADVYQYYGQTPYWRKPSPPTVTIPIPGPDGTREREDEVIGWNIPENMVRKVALFRLPVVRPLEGSSGRGLTKRA